MPLREAEQPGRRAVACNDERMGVSGPGQLAKGLAAGLPGESARKSLCAISATRLMERSEAGRSLIWKILHGRAERHLLGHFSRFCETDL